MVKGRGNPKTVEVERIFQLIMSDMWSSGGRAEGRPPRAREKLYRAYAPCGPRTRADTRVQTNGCHNSDEAASWSHPGRKQIPINKIKCSQRLRMKTIWHCGRGQVEDEDSCPVPVAVPFPKFPKQIQIFPIKAAASASAFPLFIRPVKISFCQSKQESRSPSKVTFRWGQRASSPPTSLRKTKAKRLKITIWYRQFIGQKLKRPAHGLPE